MQFEKGFCQNNYFTLSTNSLPFKLVRVDKILAKNFRNVLIIIILALYSKGTNEALKSFFFQANNSISATI